MRSIHSSQGQKSNFEHFRNAESSMTSYMKFRDVQILRKINTENKPSTIEPDNLMSDKPTTDSLQRGSRFCVSCDRKSKSPSTRDYSSKMTYKSTSKRRRVSKQVANSYVIQSYVLDNTLRNSLQN